MRSDRELVELVLDDGDEKAFRELFRRHTPRLLPFAQRMLGGSESDAEDAIQETWIRACDGFGRFRWEAALSTWLHGITLNVCRELLKRNRRLTTVDVAADELPSTVPAASQGRPIDLERAIRALPNGYREVLVLHDIEGFTHEEIGQRLGISSGGSKSQLSRARRAVRQALEPEKETSRDTRR